MARNRTKSICIRLSLEEHEVLCQKAQAAGLSVSALLRDHLLRTRIYNHKQQQRWFAVLLSLRKHLTGLAEKLGGLPTVDAAIATAYLAAIARHLDQLEKKESNNVGQVLPSRVSNE